MKLYTLLSQVELSRAILAGYVRAQEHPTLPLRILNYTEKCAYEGAWTPTTLACRGLIYNLETFDVVARPFPKFFNHGQDGAPALDLEAPAFVTDKLDGSLGILYPRFREAPGPLLSRIDGFAIATRGSFVSEQALHASEVLLSRYGEWAPHPYTTYLFEIVYPANRIVVDYGETDDLFLLAALDTDSGRPCSPGFWPGPRTEEHPYRTLAEALRAEPRPNCEGLVVYLAGVDARVKIKQDDYVALHRILTGTNARNVWEVVAVQTCASLIRDPKHWGSYLGIDPARAEQVLTLGDEWLAGVPDEFYSWVDATIAEANETAMRNYVTACHLADDARAIADRKTRFEHVSGSVFAKEVMRLASAEDAETVSDALGSLLLRCWREACPEPTAPFARSEAIA